MDIFLTPGAEKNLDSILEHISDNWGAATAGEFVRKVDHFFDLLSKYPSIGQLEKMDIRGFQISPHTRILYRVKNDKIIVLSFFDVRQTPEKKFS